MRILHRFVYGHTRVLFLTRYPGPTLLHVIVLPGYINNKPGTSITQYSYINEKTKDNGGEGGGRCLSLTDSNDREDEHDQQGSPVKSCTSADYL